MDAPPTSCSSGESAANGHPLASPLGLSAGRRRRQPEGFDLIPFFDFAVILLLFGLLGAQFVFAPGFSINLPESRGDGITGVSATAVLTLRPNMILFDGARQSRSQLEESLRRYIRERSHPAPVLLVKMDREVSMGQFLEISEIARVAGFERIQVAAEVRAPDHGSRDLLPEGGERGATR